MLLVQLVPVMFVLRVRSAKAHTLLDCLFVGTLPFKIKKLCVTLKTSQKPT